MSFELVPDHVYFNFTPQQRANYDRGLQAALQRSEIALAASNARVRTYLEMIEQDSGNIEVARQAAWFEHDRGRITKDDKDVLRFPPDWPQAVDPQAYVRETFTKRDWEALAKGGTAAPETGNKWTKQWREKLKTTL